MNRIYIEITNACNLNCSFCPEPTKALGRMSVDQFTHIIDNIKNHTHHIYLHVQGEPLSHPQLLNFMDIAYLAHLKVHIVTNATLLSFHKDLLSHPALAQCSLSLHAWEQFDDYDFNAKLEQLLHMKEAILNSNASIFLRIWNQKSERMKTILSIFINDFNSDTLLGFGKHRIKLNDHITLDLDEPFEWPQLYHPLVDIKGRCHSGLKMMAILIDGTLTPCCLDPQGILSIGNVLTTDFEELLTNPRYLRITNGFKQHVLTEELCQHCSYRTRFK